MDKTWIEQLDKLMTSKGFVEFMPGNDVGPAYDREDVGPHLWFKMVETHEYDKEVDHTYLMMSTDCVPFYLKIYDIDSLDYYLEDIFIPMLQNNELYSVLVDSRASGRWDHPFKVKGFRYKFTEKTGLEIFEREYTPQEIKTLERKKNGEKPVISRKRLPSWEV